LLFKQFGSINTFINTSILHSFNCYLYENLDLIIIFSTSLQFFFYLKWYILANIIIVLLFPIAAICRSTWRKEAIIYVLHSCECYLYENLDLIIIFSTLLQFFFYLKPYILANIVIVLLFPIAAFCRSTWKEAIIYVLHSFKRYLLGIWKSRFNNHFQYFLQFIFI
jgi:hypothetical protein